LSRLGSFVLSWCPEMSRQPQPLSRRALQAAFIIVLLPLIIPLAILSLVLLALHRAVLYMLVWLLWLPRGKDVLFVFSDSPIWRDYMAQQVLPLVQERAVPETSLLVPRYPLPPEQSKSWTSISAQITAERDLAVQRLVSKLRRRGVVVVYRRSVAQP